MPRTKRIAPGGMVFHALNRGVGRMKIFSAERDYLAFEEAIAETLSLYPMRILAYCLMPNHWHFLLWPEKDGQELKGTGPTAATPGRRERRPPWT